MDNYEIIYGKHASLAVINNPKRKIYKIYITNDKYQNFLNEIPEKYKSIIEKCDNNKIEKIIKKSKKHQGILVMCSNYDTCGNDDNFFKKMKDKEFAGIFILDEIQDPQNLGAVIRSASAFGIDAIIKPNKNSCPITASVVRASAGYSEKILIHENSNILNFITKAKENNFWILTLDSNSKNGDLFEIIKKYKKCIFVFGSEGAGVRKSILSISDLSVKIPMNENVESLNLSNTAAIVGFCYFKCLYS